MGYYKNATMEVKRPIATMEVENFGTVKMELYPEYAPQTVANFITLANRGFYNGLTFHRIVKDFMIQGGDKNGDGTGSATIKDLKDDGEDTNYSIKGEFIANGVENKLQFEEGTLAMARSDYTSYSSTLKEGISASELMKRPEVHYDDIVKMISLENPLTYPDSAQIDIEIKYQGYIDKAYHEAKRVLKLETVNIPNDIDYDKIPNIASEAREKLKEIRPLTIAQANRISGVNPADISILLVYIESTRNNEQK